MLLDILPSPANIQWPPASADFKNMWKAGLCTACSVPLHPVICSRRRSSKLVMWYKFPKLIGTFYTSLWNKNIIVSFRGTCPSDPWPGALPLDSCGDTAPTLYDKIWPPLAEVLGRLVNLTVKCLPSLKKEHYVSRVVNRYSWTINDLWHSWLAT